MKKPRKFVRIVWIVLAAVLAVSAMVAVGFVVKFYMLSPQSRPALALSAPTSHDAVARGEYLANHVAGCMRCHSSVDESDPSEPILPGMLGAGRDFGEDRKMFPGHIRSPNLTPDPDVGLGRWTDGEIARAIREGVARDGHGLFPMMPYLRYASTLSDDDTLAVVAYLRQLPPSRHDAGAVSLDFPLSMFARTFPRALKTAAAPMPTDELRRGQWLLQVANCAECHTRTDSEHRPLPGQFLAGGTPYPVTGKGIVYSANITSDPATGIGAYSDEDIIRALNEGIGKNGRRLYGMPWRDFAGLTDIDKHAIIVALRAVAPVRNLIKAPQFVDR